MAIDIQIPDDELIYLSEQAKQELINLSSKHINEILKEASRLEANRRDHHGDPEITRTMIKDAATFIKKYPYAKKKPWGFSIIQIISSLATLLVGGGLFNIEKLQNDQTLLVIFILILTVAIIFKVIEIVIGRNQ